MQGVGNWKEEEEGVVGDMGEIGSSMETSHDLTARNENETLLEHSTHSEKHKISPKVVAQTQSFT